MLPGARQALRRIGDDCDVVTYLGEYTRRRLARRSGRTPTCAGSTPGWTSTRFDPSGRGADDPRAVRPRRAAGDRVRLAAGAAQGTGRAHRSAAGDPRPRCRARRCCSSGRARTSDALRHWPQRRASAGTSCFTGAVAEPTNCRRTTRPATSSRCRAAPGGAALDVEGLGIVYLEASAVGLPVVAGDSGGAPDAVREGETGYVVDGRDLAAIVDRLVTLLRDAGAAVPAGRGRPRLGRAATGSGTRWPPGCAAMLDE